MFIASIQVEERLRLRPHFDAYVPFHLRASFAVACIDAFLRENPKATASQIEENFDGSSCVGLCVSFTNFCIRLFFLWSLANDRFVLFYSNLTHSIETGNLTGPRQVSICRWYSSANQNKMFSHFHTCLIFQQEKRMLMLRFLCFWTESSSLINCVGCIVFLRNQPVLASLWPTLLTSVCVFCAKYVYSTARRLSCPFLRARSVGVPVTYIFNDCFRAMHNTPQSHQFCLLFQSVDLHRCTGRLSSYLLSCAHK